MRASKKERLTGVGERGINRAGDKKEKEKEGGTICRKIGQIKVGGRGC